MHPQNPISMLEAIFNWITSTAYGEQIFIFSMSAACVAIIMILIGLFFESTEIK